MERWSRTRRGRSGEFQQQRNKGMKIWADFVPWWNGAILRTLAPPWQFLPHHGGASFETGLQNAKDL